MRKLMVFESITLDGFFTGKNGELGWAHADDDEELQKFTADNARGEAVMLFGRKTYDMMASFWPTDAGRRTDPVVAKAMNESTKIVFSKSMNEATWNNTRVVKTD